MEGLLPSPWDATPPDGVRDQFIHSSIDLYIAGVFSQQLFSSLSLDETFTEMKSRSNFFPNCTRNTVVDESKMTLPAIQIVIGVYTNTRHGLLGAVHDEVSSSSVSS